MSKANENLLSTWQGEGLAEGQLRHREVGGGGSPWQRADLRTGIAEVSRDHSSPRRSGMKDQTEIRQRGTAVIDKPYVRWCESRGGKMTSPSYFIAQKHWYEDVTDVIRSERSALHG